DKIPIVIINWFSELRDPRDSVGAISDRYTGTIAVEPPTAKPIINLPMTSVDIFGAAANINAPTAKTIEIIKTKRRLPNLSDKGPLKPEPKIAPINMELTTNPSVKSDRGMSVFMYNNAPEMTPMSYPYKSPPSAPKKKIIFLLILPSIFCSFFLDVILAR